MNAEQKEIYHNYLERLRLKLIDKYNELGLRASGDYERQLEGVVTNSRMTMYGAKHSEYMENGRGTGPDDYRKIAPFIQDWIEVKNNLPSIFYEKKKSMSFAIAHKIANEGIQVPNEHNAGKVVSEVVNSFLANDIYEMLRELGDVYLSTIRADIIEILQEELTAA